MRRYWPIMGFVILVALFAGGGASAAGRQMAALPTAMLDVEWKLVTLQVGGQPAEDVTDKGLTITFTADGAINGSGGCNRFFGSYTGDTSGTLTIANPLGSTLIACPQAISEREARYFKALPEVRGYVLESPTRLRLRFDQPDRMLIYTRPPSSMPQTGGGAGSGSWPWADLLGR